MLVPRTLLPRPPSSREGDRPQAVEGVPAHPRLIKDTRRSKPPVLPPIAYRGFAIAPITLRPPPRSPLYNPRVQGRNPARFNGGYGVPRGFKGEKSKFPPNPLGLAERVPRPQAVEGVPAILTSSRTPAGQNLRFCRRLHIGALRSPLSPFARPLNDTCSFPQPPVLPPQRPPSSREGDRPQTVEGVPLPHSVEKVSSLHLTGFTRRSKPPVLLPIAYRGFAIAPITLRPPSQRYSLVPRTPPQRPPSSREGDRPQAVEGVPAHRAPYPPSPALSKSLIQPRV